MKKFIIAAVFVAALAAQAVSAIYFDTEVKYTNVLNRSTRVSMDVYKDIKLGATYFVINGIGFTGELNNYTLAGWVSYKAKLMDGLIAEPFIGMGTAKSDNGRAYYGNAGVDLQYKSFLTFVAGADGQVYVDSYIMDYRGGIRIPVLSMLSVDLLYSAVLATDRHKTGFGGRLNLIF